MIRYQDIHASDKSILENYKELMVKNKINEAQQLVSNMQSKTLNAESFIQLEEAISDLENYYFDYIRHNDTCLEYFEQLLISISSLVEEYSPTKQYRYGNFVTKNRNTYFCIKDYPPKNIDPDSSTEYWERIDGIKGDSPVVFTLGKYKGNWRSSTTYSKGDIVSFSNMIYISNFNNNTGHNPIFELSFWTKGIDTEIYQNIYPLSEEQPIDANIGDLWLERID